MKRYCDRCGVKLKRRERVIVMTKQGWGKLRPLPYCATCALVIREENKGDEEQDAVHP